MKLYQSVSCMRSVVVACSSLIALQTGAASTVEIFKSVDSQGRPLYSDRPPPGPAERIYLPSTPQRDEEVRERTAAELAELKRREAEREAAQTLQAEEKAVSEVALRAQQQRCERVRNRYLMFSEANRLYRRDAQGNRVYYTGAEIDAEREKAKAEMQASCIQ